MFGTLGDATRLQLLEALLARGEATQSQLLDHVEVAQPPVSDHLGCLTWCGFITAHRDGRTVTYRVADPRAGTFITLARRFLETNEAAVGNCTILDRENTADAT